ncbi:MAG: hypothetical protein WAJ99_16800 [Candidatus Sulfotelmatobacter sp.]
MEWTVVLAGPARKYLKRIPASDKTRILTALAEMQQDPFQGDIASCKVFPVFAAASATGEFCSK